MYRLTRGQLVGLLTIAIIFAIAAFIFDKIIDYKSNKVDYMTYDEKVSSTLLKGSYIEYVNLGSEYKEKGINTKKDYTVSYLKNGNEVIDIDTNDFGTYQVSYYIENEETIHRTVIIVDKKAPSITVPSKQTITSSEVNNFDLRKDVKATDNSGEVELTYENTLSNTPGDYIITYKATDSSNNVTYKKRLIKVVDTK